MLKSELRLSQLCVFAPLLVLSAGCAVAPPDHNPHSAAETASRSTVVGSTVRTPVYYQDVLITFELEAALSDKPTPLLLIYIAPGNALLQDCRWVFHQAVLEDGSELAAEAFTENIDGKLHTSRLSVPLKRELLESCVDDELELRLIGQSNWYARRRVRIPGFFIRGMLMILDSQPQASD